MTEHTPDLAGQYLGDLTQLVGQIDVGRITEFAGALFDAWRDDRWVFLFGNGGSAATASHITCDLSKAAAVDGRRRLRAMCLIDNISIATALSNDISYETIFRYPLQTYARKGDLAVAISASGNSPNVVQACQWAREAGVKVIGITGFDGGKLKELADLNIHVPSSDYGMVEDIHLMVGHCVSRDLKSRIEAEATAD